MKKSYKTPAVEKIEFQYDQVVATSKCTNQWINTGDTFCEKWEYVRNFYG